MGCSESFVIFVFEILSSVNCLAEKGSDYHVGKRYWCRVCHRSWTNICYLRPEAVIALFLSTVTALQLLYSVIAFIVTLLDYCNSLLSGITKILLDKLQSVWNAVDCLVSKPRKFNHIMMMLWDDLHWLLIKQLFQSYCHHLLVLHCNTSPTEGWWEWQLVCTNLL